MSNSEREQKGQIIKELTKPWREVNAEWKRSKKSAPFCPFCGEELDSLSMMNYTDSCKCGMWSDSFHGKESYREYPSNEAVEVELTKRLEKRRKIAEKRKKATYLKLKKEYEK